MKLNADIMIFAPWIDGEAQAGVDSFPVLNPSNGSPIGNVVESTDEHAERAIMSANTAFLHWKSKPPRERAQIIESWAEQIDLHLTDLASILTSENGKNLAEAKDELSHGANALRWSAQSLLRLHGETLPNHSPSQKNYTIKQPIGIVACITPWNFPAAAILVKVGAALAAGCSVIVKPSEETPLIALALAKLSAKAKMPNGVINILPCSQPENIASALCQDHRIKMLSFTGSTVIGKKLYASCAQTVKRIALELGGNAPYIVFADADLDKAVDDAINARFYNSGQICVGANRFFIHESIYTQFAEKLARRMSCLSMGDGFDENSTIGPVINKKAKQRLIHLVDEAIANGAQRITPHAIENADNLFFPPTLLINTTKEMRVYSEEIFGPIACLYSFTDDKDVIKAANDTHAGLVAYIYSQNIAKLIHISEHLDAAVIGANSTHIFSSDLPFGGIKQSGIGSEHGLNCLEEFIQSKSVCLELNYRE